MGLKEMLGFKKTKFNADEFDAYLKQLGLETKDVIGKDVWYLMDPARIFRTRSQIYFRKVKSSTQSMDSGLEVTVSGTMVSLPCNMLDRTAKLEKHNFSYSTIKRYTL